MFDAGWIVFSILMVGFVFTILVGVGVFDEKDTLTSDDESDNLKMKEKD